VQIIIFVPRKTVIVSDKFDQSKLKKEKANEKIRSAAFRTFYFLAWGMNIE
jgi:hypothetical protein